MVVALPHYIFWKATQGRLKARETPQSRISWFADKMRLLLSAVCWFTCFEARTQSIRSLQHFLTLRARGAFDSILYGKYSIFTVNYAVAVAVTVAVLSRHESVFFDFSSDDCLAMACPSLLSYTTRASAKTIRDEYTPFDTRDGVASKRLRYWLEY